MELGARIQSLEIDSKNYIIKFTAPAYFVGLDVSDIHMEINFKLHLIAVSRRTGRTNILGVAHQEPEVVYPTEKPESIKIEEGDVLTVFGALSDFRAMYRHIS